MGSTRPDTHKVASYLAAELVVTLPQLSKNRARCSWYFHTLSSLTPGPDHMKPRGPGPLPCWGECEAVGQACCRLTFPPQSLGTHGGDRGQFVDLTHLPDRHARERAGCAEIESGRHRGSRWGWSRPCPAGGCAGARRSGACSSTYHQPSGLNCTGSSSKACARPALQLTRWPDPAAVLRAAAV